MAKDVKVDSFPVDLIIDDKPESYYDAKTSIVVLNNFLVKFKVKAYKFFFNSALDRFMERNYGKKE